MQLAFEAVQEILHDGADSSTEPQQQADCVEPSMEQDWAAAGAERRHQPIPSSIRLTQYVRSLDTVL